MSTQPESKAPVWLVVVFIMIVLALIGSFIDDDDSTPARNSSNSSCERAARTSARELGTNYNDELRACRQINALFND